MHGYFTIIGLSAYARTLPCPSISWRERGDSGGAQPPPSPKPKPPPRPIRLLLRRQRTRPIGDLSRVIRQLRRILPTIDHTQGAGAERWRFRRPLSGVAIAFAPVQVHHRAVPPARRRHGHVDGGAVEDRNAAPETTPTPASATGAAGPQPDSSNGGIRTNGGRPRCMPPVCPRKVNEPLAPACNGNDPRLLPRQAAAMVRRPN
jgi:hypothetical protein